MLERSACDQLNAHFQRHGLLPEHQSAYRRCHSTETAMLKVPSDAYVAADAGHVTLLSLLDLSAAFVTVDHQILVERLRRTYGLSARALDWISSYLSGRTQFVRYNGKTSQVMPVTSGVPQGSVLGPVIFILYAADVIKLVEDAGFSVHVYADDLQINGHAGPPQSTELKADMADCLFCRDMDGQQPAQAQPG